MIVAGFGFRAQASCASLQSALERAATDRVIDAVATPADKAGAPCISQLATERNLPVRAISAAVLQAVSTATQSAQSRAHRGTGSVAEAVALAAAGPGARLLVHRHISQDRLATCAIAIGKET